MPENPRGRDLPFGFSEEFEVFGVEDFKKEDVVEGRARGNWEEGLAEGEVRVGEWEVFARDCDWGGEFVRVWVASP